MINFIKWHETRHKDAPGQGMLWGDQPEQPMKPKAEFPTEEEAYRNTPFALFGHDTKAAEAAGWRFEQAEKGYNGNRAAYYAISPDGFRYKWEQTMRHGGADPWSLDYNSYWTLKAEKQGITVQQAMHSKKEKKSPFVKKYEQFKKDHPNMMILFRMGDFYELFYDDAEKAAKTLGLTITSRTDQVSGQKMAMAGFPHHQLETYLRKLMSSGHKVAIADKV